MSNTKKDRGSAIIPYENGLILIHRVKGSGKNIQDYYTIPGGGKEENESIENATKREIFEELGIDIQLLNTCYKLNAVGREQYFYVAKYISGKLGSGLGEEMTKPNYARYGSYTIEIVAKEKIQNINLLPNEIKEIILRDIDSIFNDC